MSAPKKVAKATAKAKKASKPAKKREAAVKKVATAVKAAAPKKAKVAAKPKAKPTKPTKTAAKKSKAAPARKAAKPSRAKRSKGTMLEFNEVVPEAAWSPPAAKANPVSEASAPLRIALFGASGSVGSRIAEEALERGHTVTALVRNPDRLGTINPKLKVVRGDVTDPLQVAIAARNHDVVASAIAPPMNELAVLSHAAKSLLSASRETGKRVVAVGGAGSLRIASGGDLLDSTDFAQDWRPIANAHRNALNTFRAKGEGAVWTVVSPSALFEPGKRTGKFRVGADDLLTDKKGKSSISMEDYAVAFVDELERGDHAGQRMTVGY